MTSDDDTNRDGLGQVGLRRLARFQRVRFTTAMSENTETAILAGGCFRPAQELPRLREGVISTRVGYTGGENDNPTDDNHPGHAEAVEVIFDPERTSYRDILEFFQIHRPDLGEELAGSGYRSEIFYTSDEQRQVAEDTIATADASALWPGKVVTKISEAGPLRRGCTEVPRAAKLAWFSRTGNSPGPAWWSETRSPPASSWPAASVMRLCTIARSLPGSWPGHGR